MRGGGIRYKVERQITADVCRLLQLHEFTCWRDWASTVRRPHSHLSWDHGEHGGREKNNEPCYYVPQGQVRHLWYESRLGTIIDGYFREQVHPDFVDLEECDARIVKKSKLSQNRGLSGGTVASGAVLLSCRNDFQCGPPNPVAVEQPQGFVQPLPTPPFPAEARAFLGSHHMVPDLLFYPVLDEVEALAGVSDRKVIHPSA
jgi:hypothetical protein